MNTDNLFPLFYHAQHQNYLEDLPFWLGLAATQGSPILELGCGSGRVLLPLALAGHRVLGIDNDAWNACFAAKAPIPGCESQDKPASGRYHPHPAG